MKPLLSALLVLFTSIAADAQEAPEFPEPTEQHKWLQQFVGEWESTSKGVMAEGQPEITMKGSISSTMLGEFWVVNNFKSEVAGAQFTGIQTIGYDPEKKKYVGTWVDSMTNYMWIYEGSVSEDGTTLTLEAEGPNMTKPGTTALYRDIYQFQGADRMSIKSMAKTDGDKWVTFLQGESTRKTE